jgi:hypothetical protein
MLLCFSQTRLRVFSGQVLAIFIGEGGQGTTSGRGGKGGWNGGGNGGSGEFGGGGGGGATTIHGLLPDLMV